MDAIRAAEIIVSNPFYNKNSYRVDLRPESVEWIVFWSRNYENFLQHQDFFAEYNLFFHFTILSHHPYLEKYNIKLQKAIRQVEELVSIYGPERLIWRYDPIVVWREGNKLETNFNINDFTLLCEEFGASGISRCYFSFVAPYKKFITRFRDNYPKLKITNYPTELHRNILISMKEISQLHKIALFSCCNDGLVNGDFLRGSCISGKLLNHISGEKRVSEAKAPTRKDCGCTRAIDIGNYAQQPCHFGCIYCYANPVW
jgi:hypothetical protein